jgi:uncharacterized protein (DUF362 family)
MFGKWLRRLYAPRVLTIKHIAGMAAPRHSLLPANPDIATVWRADSVQSPGDFFSRLEPVWKKQFRLLYPPASRVLIKINLNTADPYPASTSPEMLDGLLSFLQKQGLRNILVGDCSSVSCIPTRKVACKTGILDVVSSRGAEFVCFDQQKWRTVKVPGRHLNEISLPESLWQTDRLIYLANMKTHRLAGFSLGSKLAVGFMHPAERFSLHRDGCLEERISEVALAVTPDLTIIDARLAFVTGGPDKGRIGEPGTILMSNQLMAADLKAYQLLFETKQKLDCPEGLQPDPFTMAQFRHARDLQLCPWKQIETVAI